jgi:hypothetical protein
LIHGVGGFDGGNGKTVGGNFTFNFERQVAGIADNDQDIPVRLIDHRATDRTTGSGGINKGDISMIAAIIIPV